MQQDQIKQESNLGIAGIWHIHSFDAKPFQHLSDQETEKLFMDAYKKYQLGESPFQFPNGVRPEKTIKKNKVVNGLIYTIIHRMLGTYTGTEDLQARKLAIGFSNVAPNSGNAQLGLEKFRFNFTDVNQDANKAIFVTFVGRNSGNGNETAVVSDVGNTLTQFKVSPGTAVLFNIGDRIRVTTTAFDFRTITNIDIPNDIITIDSNLSALAAGGAEVIQVWAEAGIFGNTNAGNTVNTGTLFNRVNQLEYAKDNTKLILVEVQFILTSV